MVWTFPAALSAPAAARHAAREFAAVQGADNDTLAAVALCITEAVANVAVHAYRDQEGVGTVRMTGYVDDESCLWFHIHDHGHGLAPRTDSPGLGLGLPIISQVATEMAVRTPEEGGTEIVMQFSPLQATAADDERMSAHFGTRPPAGRE